MRRLRLEDEELALVLAHEAAHVLAGHALQKPAFMTGFVGTQKVPTASLALHEFFAQDAYAAAFRPQALLQEREADRLGAAIFFAAGYDARRALTLFDKLARLESDADSLNTGSHDAAQVRKQAVAAALSAIRGTTEARR